MHSDRQVFVDELVVSRFEGDSGESVQLKCFSRKCFWSLVIITTFIVVKFYNLQVVEKEICYLLNTKTK